MMSRSGSFIGNRSERGVDNRVGSESTTTNETTPGNDDDGWVVTRYDDVKLKIVKRKVGTSDKSEPKKIKIEPGTPHSNPTTSNFGNQTGRKCPNPNCPAYIRNQTESCGQNQAIPSTSGIKIHSLNLLDSLVPLIGKLTLRYKAPDLCKGPDVLCIQRRNFMIIIFVPGNNSVLTLQGLKLILDAFQKAEKNINCKAVLLSSNGAFFCSGVSLQELNTSTRELKTEIAHAIQDVILAMAKFPKPIVAGVNGTTYGLGLSILAQCDIVVAKETAMFQVNATRFGHIPEGGLVRSLPNICCLGKLSRFFYQNQRITASEACEIGLVSEVYVGDNFDWKIHELVKEIISLPSMTAIQMIKRAFRISFLKDLEEQLEKETATLPSMWNSCRHEFQEALDKGWPLDLGN